MPFYVSVSLHLLFPVPGMPSLSLSIFPVSGAPKTIHLLTDSLEELSGLSME